MKGRVRHGDNVRLACSGGCNHLVDDSIESGYVLVVDTRGCPSDSLRLDHRTTFVGVANIYLSDADDEYSSAWQNLHQPLAFQLGYCFANGQPAHPEMLCQGRI